MLTLTSGKHHAFVSPLLQYVICKHDTIELTACLSQVGLQVTEYLNHHYPKCWICHFGPQAQTARLPDLIVLNYFLWVKYEDHVLPGKLQAREEMLQQIMLSSDSRRGSYEVIQRTSNC
jgi:hypothetical protein